MEVSWELEKIKSVANNGIGNEGGIPCMFQQELGRHAYSQQLQQSLQQPVTAVQPQNASELQLNNMGKYALRNLAKELGLMQSAKNNDELKERIRKHLDSSKK